MFHYVFSFKVLTDDDVGVSDSSNLDVVLKFEEERGEREFREKVGWGKKRRPTHHREDEGSDSEREESQRSGISELSVVDGERGLTGID